MATEQPSLAAHLQDIWQLTQRRYRDKKNWWTTLKLRRQFSLDFVSLNNVSVRIPSGQLPDCDSCLHICCTGKKSRVRLRLTDIASLVHLGHADAIDTSHPLPLAGDPKPHFLEQVMPHLRQDKTHTCVLLNEDRLCSIYPSWPLSCARYPYAFDADNKVIFWAKGCQSTKQVSLDDAPDSIRSISQAAIETYNQDVRDILMLHYAKDELREARFEEWVKIQP